MTEPEDRQDDDELPITSGAAARIDKLGRSMRRYIDRKFLRMEVAIGLLGLACAVGLYLGYVNSQGVNNEGKHRRAASRAESVALCDQQTRGTAGVRALIIVATKRPPAGTPQARRDDPKARLAFRRHALAVVGGPRPPCLAKLPELERKLVREHVIELLPRREHAH